MSWLSLPSRLETIATYISVHIWTCCLSRGLFKWMRVRPGLPLPAVTSLSRRRYKGLWRARPWPMKRFGLAVTQTKDVKRCWKHWRGRGWRKRIDIVSKATGSAFGTSPIRFSKVFACRHCKLWRELVLESDF